MAASAVFILCAGLLFAGRFSAGLLGVLWLPQGWVTGALGTLPCGAGLAFAIWARRRLGANWSGIVALKEDLELVQSGPYRLVRRPSYTGMLAMLLGTAAVLGETRGLLAFGLCLGGMLLRIRREEALMMQQFPGDYPEFKARTRLLIPWIM